MARGDVRVHGGCAWWGVCMAGGCVWQGATCMAGGPCVADTTRYGQ